MSIPIKFLILVPIIISTKVLWSQDIPYPDNEYNTNDYHPREYNYNDNENLELQEPNDEIDKIHMRGFGSNTEQDEYEDSFSYKRDGWEIVE